MKQCKKGYLAHNEQRLPKQMGIPMSIIGRGIVDPLAQMLYIKLVNRSKITDFNDFHIAVIDTICTINSAVPGNHYIVPNESDVKSCFDEWKSKRIESEKEKLFVDFIVEKVKISKGDNAVAVTGLVAPPIAMALRQKGEQKLPLLKVLKIVPDAVFVPFVTLVAVTSVKLGRKIFNV